MSPSTAPPLCSLTRTARIVPLTRPQTVTFCAMTLPSTCAPSLIWRSEARTSPSIRPKTCAGPLHSMLPTIDMSEPMQEAIPAFVVGSDLAHWSCCITLPSTYASPPDAFLSISGAPFFVMVNMSTSCFRRYEDTMRESADSSTRHQRYHVLIAATFSNGDNRNFVHMKSHGRRGTICIRGSRNLFAVAGSSQLVQGECPQLKMCIPSKSSMDGDRQRHGRAPAPGSTYRKSPRCFMMPRTKFITNTSHVLPKDG